MTGDETERGGGEKNMLLQTSEATESGEGLPPFMINKAVEIVREVEHSGVLDLAKDTVYSEIVAMPQMARTAEWSFTFAALAVRSIITYLLNMCCQFFLAYMLYVSGFNNSAFASKMHLCSFGARHQSCPAGTNCIGPDGTTYTPERLYSFDIWYTRKFVRDSMIQLFPEKKHHIEKAVDPGEYGIESIWCRYICIFIFCLTVMDDLANTVELCQLLYYIPNTAEPWFQYSFEDLQQPQRASPPEGQDVPVPSREMRTSHRLKGQMSFKVRGMPWWWKLIYVFLVIIPKLMIWKAVAFMGVYYLLETAEIMNLIINTTALTFIISLDELIFKYLAASSTQWIMKELQGFDSCETPTYTRVPSKADDKSTDQGETRLKMRHVLYMVPKQLIATFILCGLFVLEYYHSNCLEQPDGSMVSKTVYYPDEHYPWTCMFMNCRHDTDKVMWEMPDATDSDL